MPVFPGGDDAEKMTGGQLALGELSRICGGGLVSRGDLRGLHPRFRSSSGFKYAVVDDRRCGRWLLIEDRVFLAAACAGHKSDGLTARQSPVWPDSRRIVAERRNDAMGQHET